jgi:hypothetical protein
MSRRRPASARRKEQPTATAREKIAAVLAFVAIMGGVYAIWWFLQRPPVRQFPLDINVEITGFMLPVPSGAIHFRIVNFTQVRMKTAGVELLKNETLISLATPRLNITTSDINWAEDIEVEEGMTANVLGMSSGNASRLASILAGATVTRELLAGVTTFRVLTTNGTWGKLAIVGDLVVYSDQSPDPTSSVEKILTTIAAGESRLFDDEDIRRAFYVATQDGPFFGLSYTYFYHGEEIGADVLWMFSFAKYAEQLIEKEDMFKLATQQDAINNFDRLKPMYFVKGQNPYIIGPFIVVRYDYVFDDLRSVVMSL